MQNPQQFPIALAVVLAIAPLPASSAQCQGRDGAWYDYTSPMCQPAQPAPKPKAKEAPPSYFEPGIMFGDLTATHAMTLRGVVREKGWLCETVSGVRSCFWGCDYHLDCDNFTNTYEIDIRGGRVFVEAK